MFFEKKFRNWRLYRFQGPHYFSNLKFITHSNILVLIPKFARESGLSAVRRESLNIICSKWFYLLVVVLGLTTALTTLAGPQKISMCTEHWPPFVIVEKGKDVTQGSWVVVLHKIFDGLTDYWLDIEVSPWKRCLIQVREGQVDGTFGHFEKDDRKVYMDFTAFVVSDRSMVWYSTKNFPKSFSWDKFKDLTQYKFGLIRGEKFNNEIDHLISSQQIKSETVTEDAQNFKKLALGRIDALVKNEKVGWALARELKISSLVKPAAKPAYENKRYLSFSKKKNHHRLIKLINQQIELMRSKGEIRKILGYAPL